MKVTVYTLYTQLEDNSPEVQVFNSEGDLKKAICDAVRNYDEGEVSAIADRMEEIIEMTSAAWIEQLQAFESVLCSFESIQCAEHEVEFPNLIFARLAG